MKVPISWLSDYVNPLPPTDALAETLTMLGLEVDSVEKTGAGLENVLVGKIITKEPHPNADRLSLCQVTVGHEPLQIVCGANNMDAGDYVAVAQPGTTLPNGVKLKKSKIRGVQSLGMMCSLLELGLGEDHDGIIILDGEPTVGTPFAEAYQLADEVVDLELTPNRGDCFSMLGVARETAAAFGLKANRPEVTPGAVDNGPQVDLQCPEDCPRFSAILIENVTVGRSPDWLARRLERAGVRSINNVVDATNYVMLEYGQPPHAFDYDALHENRIVVRRARPGETLTLLDEDERKLTEEDLVICDADRPVALAGVMGGLETEVTDRTTRILLENAFFAPIPLRRKAKRHSHSTDASQRFERGINLDGLVEAAWRCANLIAELTGGSIAGGMTLVDGPDECLQPYSRREVSLRPSRTEHLLGVAIGEETIREKLEAIGLTCLEQSKDRIRFEIPAFRHDLQREVDLIEEVARTVGYNEFPSTISPLPFGRENQGVERQTLLERVRRSLMGRGWREAVTYSFVARDKLKLWSSAKPHKIANPLSQQQEVMRTSVVPSLLECLARNQRRGLDEVALFEIARTFGGESAGVEPGVLAGVLSTPREPGWRGGRDAGGWRDFFDAKSDIENLLKVLGVSRYEWVETQHPAALHPGFASRLVLEEQDWGFLGVLHPGQVEALELSAAPVVFQLELDPILEAVKQSTWAYTQPSEFPAVTRDLALVMPDSVHAGGVERVIRDVTGPMLESCRLFDVYQGDQTGGDISLGFRYTLRSAKDTLTDKVVEKTEDRILRKLQQEYGITRRQ